MQKIQNAFLLQLEIILLLMDLNIIYKIGGV